MGWGNTPTGNLPVEIQSMVCKEEFMAQKVIEIVGVSKESFAKAAENAVAEASKQFVA